MADPKCGWCGRKLPVKMCSPGGVPTPLCEECRGELHKWRSGVMNKTNLKVREVLSSKEAENFTSDKASHWNDVVSNGGFVKLQVKQDRAVLYVKNTFIDSRLIGRGRLSDFSAFQIKSISRPEFYWDDLIYINGTDSSKSGKVISRFYASPEEASLHLNRLLQAMTTIREPK